jgi:hypothetical protein
LKDKIAIRHCNVDRRLEGRVCAVEVNKRVEEGVPVDEFYVLGEEVEDRATLIIHKKIETVENVIRALNLLEQDGRIGDGKAGIDNLVEICLIEKNDWIMWRSGSDEKWRLDNVDEMRHMQGDFRTLLGLSIEGGRVGILGR